MTMTNSFTYDPQEIVPVIASFDKDGHVRPLYVRILGKPYRILSHWTPRSNFSGITEYNCKVETHGYARQILLKYYSRERIWTIPANTK